MAYNNHHNKKQTMKIRASLLLRHQKQAHKHNHIIVFSFITIWARNFTQKNKCYRLNEEKEGVGIILVINGLVAAIDSHSGIYTHTLYPPTIVGLIHGLRAFNEMSGPMKNILIAETDATLVFVPLQVFIDKVDNDNLWHDVAKIPAHRLMAMKSKEREFLSTDAYRIIKTLIQRYGFIRKSIANI